MALLYYHLISFLPTLATAAATTTTTSTSSTSPSPTTPLPNDCSITSTKFGATEILAIGVGDALVILVALVLLVGMYMWVTKMRRSSIQQLKPHHGCHEEKRKDGGLVCFRGVEDLRLDCLLKSSAEILGKGMVGSTYKAVLGDGIVVAVKKLNAERFPSHGKGFDRHMRLIGRVRHCHVVSLLAYCNAQEDRLLVYDYAPNGSLHSLLHSNTRGKRGLDWTRRKQILMGAAHGLNFIHTFPARSPLVHANIKPSNILIDEQGNALISEWGIMCFADSFHQPCPTYSSEFFSCMMNCRDASTWHGYGYRAPELSASKMSATQESDVYSFGMVLLKVVTDKEMDAESQGEVMGMVKIGMMCTKECPEERPTMSEVVRMINEML